ncbi:MAG: GGDEF domain-containing protein [Acidobacteria bacterium]|nr:GGDEF domain-containing protein [Acidobacteriota bacterium]MCA1609325.1 GGDEF domain-containing protein [Acidobacteriota bacterium]
MALSSLGLFVQTVGAGLLALIFLYLSRSGGNRVLNAAGYGWLFLFLALSSLLLSYEIAIPFANLPYEYFKLLYFVSIIVAADRMEHESSLGRPLRTTALVGLVVSFGIVALTRTGSLFFAVHMAVAGIAWFIITVLIFRSRAGGLGKTFSGILAAITTLLQMTYVVFFAVSASNNEQVFPFLSYTGFYDLFLQMLFGIGLIIWAMEDTERRLTTVHARAVDDTQRSKRRAQIDPLTEAYNRFFLDDLRPTLAREPAGGSIVLIDVDGLKTINDKEGHEEGDKAIWTVAAAVKKLIRGDDYLIRWGGDEFLVVLPGMDQEVAKKRFYMLPSKIEEVRQSQRSAARAYKKFVAASVGVTPFSSRVPLDMAIETADRVMYERKKALKQMRGEPLQRGSGGPARETPTGTQQTRRTWDKTSS